MRNLVRHNPQVDQIAKPHYYYPRESLSFVLYPITELVSCFHLSNLGAQHGCPSQHLLSPMPIEGHYYPLHIHPLLSLNKHYLLVIAKSHHCTIIVQQPFQKQPSFNLETGRNRHKHGCAMVKATPSTRSIKLKNFLGVFDEGDVSILDVSISS